MAGKNNFNQQATVALKDSLNLKVWQKIQDNFAAVTDVSMRTYDAEGRPVIAPSFQPRLCQQLSRQSPLRDKLCGLCLPTFLGGKAVVDKNLSYSCLAGFHNFFVPLRFGSEKIAGYIVFGPVILIARKPKEEYLRLANDLNTNAEELWSAILEIKVVSLHYMQSLTQLIADVFAYTAKMEGEEAGQKSVKSEDAKWNRVLEILLDVALEMSQADIGSVMLLDEKKQMLTIRNSQGLPEEVKKNSRVYLGEGISGIAAQEGSAFLLNKNIQDNRLKVLLRRPYINSAMVLPLRLHDKIVGVVNLGTKSPSVNFTQDNINIMQKLISLVNVSNLP
ncbi:MAG: PocR ligand-binding domain-containing protein [Candidatus Omnitrophica bacterium]|nr:PocR ligand-binding domain-containing protein [Candidatus Omnitrophota bacterium]MDD5653955.1 PocR ligand-binding domain-containing protein [Candidatus Omnitrophota bacterium]